MKKDSFSNYLKLTLINRILTFLKRFNLVALLKKTLLNSLKLLQMTKKLFIVTKKHEKTEYNYTDK